MEIIWEICIYIYWLLKYFHTQITLALFVQENSFKVVPFPSLLTKQGPFSINKAIWDEQPGPPVNQITNGSLEGSDRDSSSQKKYDLAPNEPEKFI